MKLTAFFQSMVFRVLALCGMLAAVVAAFLYFHVGIRPPFPGVHAPLVQQEAYWETRIRTVGGKAAYQEFASDVQGALPSLQHESAHQFGGALYTVEGLPGLTVCDANFEYGCFHEFMGEAIAALGLSVITQLNQECFSIHGIGLACQHGIGHGILASLGYTFGALTQALGVCKNLPYNDPIGGCYSGVFMEYDFETTLAEQARTRPVQGDWFAPCDHLQDVYNSSCYYSLPQWWAATLRSSDDNLDNVFKRVGALCDQSPKQFRRSCFEGIGVITPPDAGYDPQAAHRLCIDTTANAREQLYCLSDAANAFSVSASDGKEEGLPVCDGLTGDAYQYCADYATNKWNSANQINLQTGTSP